MNMEENSIRKYANLMQEFGLTGLEICKNGETVRLERTNPVKEAAFVNAVQHNETEEDSPDFINVRSPMVGVFYRSPAENAAPFVQVGDTVQKGDVLGAVEAMKLINEIIAEQNGIVAEVCAENNSVVDFGHILFRLRKGRE